MQQPPTFVPLGVLVIPQPFAAAAQLVPYTFVPVPVLTHALVPVGTALVPILVPVPNYGLPPAIVLVPAPTYTPAPTSARAYAPVTAPAPARAYTTTTAPAQVPVFGSIVRSDPAYRIARPANSAVALPRQRQGAEPLASALVSKLYIMCTFIHSHFIFDSDVLGRLRRIIGSDSVLSRYTCYTRVVSCIPLLGFFFNIFTCQTPE